MSKMLKKELYEYCKTLIKENQKLQLFNNSQEEEIKELEKDLEYFQNKCEIMEKELIEEEETNQSFEMVENLTEESAKKEDTIIKLEKDNKKLQESIVELEAVILSKPNIFYFSYYDEEHIFYDNIEDLVTNTAHIQDCYVYEGNVTKEDIKSNHNDFGESWSVEIDYMVKK